MLLRDLLPDLEYWSITVLATDINTQHLERARRGVYGEWAFREARSKMLHSEDVADCVLLAIQLPARAIVEELIIRPR